MHLEDSDRTRLSTQKKKLLTVDTKALQHIFHHSDQFQRSQQAQHLFEAILGKGTQILHDGLLSTDRHLKAYSSRKVPRIVVNAK